MSDRFKFRIPHQCCTCGSFRWLFCEISGHGFENDCEWGPRSCAKCPTYGMGQGFRANGDPEFSTGLKDEDGKLIFERDILKVEDPNGDEIPSIPVQWDDNACTYPVEVGIFSDFDVTSVGWAQQMEYKFWVIGNIHENPELLTEKEKDNEAEGGQVEGG